MSLHAIPGTVKVQRCCVVTPRARVCNLQVKTYTLALGLEWSTYNSVFLTVLPLLKMSKFSNDQLARFTFYMENAPKINKSLYRVEVMHNAEIFAIFFEVAIFEKKNT